MNTELDKRLEAEIGRELSGLPELAAPDDLASRVMGAIQRRATLPWHRRSWQTWPAVLQAASLFILAAMFAALCFGAWKLGQTETVTTASLQAGEWIAGVNAIGKTLLVLLNAVVVVVKNLGTWFIVLCLVMWALGYAACVGLGTMLVRFAFARHREIKL